ncbi:hypothetical protein DM02DRAFT_223767 [Periconia macrospinosa]|uniref:Condensation domain-containing protein n=1 Tax=Periconia macrospinosa TaxID=97972 RepID=A0A2V1D625_9PLEO|nr:hypothetical protein DM02DRAFT_223767 [Periconia macrospinosa]
MPILTWNETRPGRWERPLSSLEKFNLINRNVEKALDRDNWVKTVVAKLQFDPSLGDPADALKNAWKQVRFHHPEVAAVPYNGQYIYRTSTADQLDLWVSATFVVEDDLTVDDLYGNIPRNEQMMCYFLRKTSEVMIRSPHYRLDARGAIFCLDLLIKSLGKPNEKLEWGTCAKNLSHTVDEVLDIPYEYTPEIRKAAEARLEDLKPKYPLIGLTPKMKSRMPGATRRRLFKYTTPELRELSMGFKKLGWDGQVTIHAALITTCVVLSPPDQKRSYLASYHSDLRRLIPERSRTKKAPIVSTTIINKEIVVSSSTLLKDVYAQLAHVYDDVDGNFVKSQACYLEKLAALLYPNGREPFGSEVDGQLQPRLSSFGVVEDKLLVPKIDGVVELKDFWVGVETFTKKIMVHTWMYNNEGFFHVSYNENFWDEAYMDRFVDTLNGVLMEVRIAGRA